jgi:hypothetical protein
MKKIEILEKTFLVFNRKEIQFEVPDDFPEDQIPVFTNLKEFKKWHKLKKFKAFKINENSENDYVINFTWSDHAKESVSNLIKEIDKNKHLIEGNGFPEAIALSLAPERYFIELSKTYLPREAYEKVKKKLLLKYPNQKFQEIVSGLITHYSILQDSSEPFINFLFDESITLNALNFFDLNFSYYGNFEENDEWDENSEPPFTLKKVEMLLNMSKKDVNKDNFDKVIENLISLISTSQEEKLKLILEKGKVPLKVIDHILKNNPSISKAFKSLLEKYK